MGGVGKSFGNSYNITSPIIHHLTVSTITAAVGCLCLRFGAPPREEPEGLSLTGAATRPAGQPRCDISPPAPHAIEVILGPRTTPTLLPCLGPLRRRTKSLRIVFDG